MHRRGPLAGPSKGRVLQVSGRVGLAQGRVVGWQVALGMRPAREGKPEPKAEAGTLWVHSAGRKMRLA